MSNIVVFNSITLDGVMQAPARADEDTRDEFTHGGWAVPYASPEQGEVAAESMQTTGALLLGRRTYEDLYAVWHGRTDNAFGPILDNSPKYVASRTLRMPLIWQNSTLLSDGTDGVARLRREHGKDIVILGSGELIGTLMAAGLIDRYILQIHPLVLGSGRHLFPDGGTMSTLRLVDTRTTSSGVIVATYEPMETAAR